MPTMTADHARDCVAFLVELRRTANAKLSAERVGVGLQKLHHRRRTYPAFAAEWASAVAFAEANLAKHGRREPTGGGAKTVGGEYIVTGAVNRAWQVKRAAAGRITAEGERRFLAALAATCNVNLACDVIGVSDGAIYQRRKMSAAFTERMDAALEIGYETLATALLRGAIASLDTTGGTNGGAASDDWLDGLAAEPSPWSRMSFDQALMVLGMHHKRVKGGGRRRAHNEKPVTAADTDAAITDLLKRLHIRRDAGGVPEWTRDAEFKPVLVKKEEEA